MILTIIKGPVSLGLSRVVIPVSPTTITIGALTIRASTAAWPSTSAPTMLTACPMELGILAPASRRISKIVSMSTASTTVGNGTDKRAAAILSSSRVGTISWL
ncbi:hypothetical protein D3C80_1714830 [compost metagenome]